MRKKILFTITKSVWGGAQKYVFDLATHLPSDHYEVVVVAGGQGPLLQKLEKENTKTMSLAAWQRDISLFKEVKAFVDILKILRKERPAIVHANSSKAGVTVLAARLTGVPRIIFTAHGWPFNDPVGAFNRFLRWFFSWMTALLSHDVITVSKHNFDQGVRMPGARDKMHLIHNGIPHVNMPTKEKARAFWLEQLLLSTKDSDRIFFIGAIGEMNRNKNLSSAIRALAGARMQAPEIDMRLCIIGDGEERPILTDLVRQLHLEDVVYMPGPNREFVEHLSGFDVFVMPSKKEGLPYAILEAGLAELPVIATNVGGIPEIIQSQHNGILVSPDADEEIGKAYIDFARSPEKRTDFGSNLSKTIRTSFSLARMLTETEDLYEQVS